MVILLGGSEQDISMFLDTPRLRDEPRDEEGRDEGRLNRLHRLHRGLQRCGEAIERKASTGVDQHGGKNAPALRMTVRMTRTMREQRNRDSNRGELRDTLSLHRCRGQIRHARYATDTPRYSKIRQDTPRYAEPDTPRYAEPDTPRYAEPAARVRYKYEICFGKNGRAGMIQYSIWIYLFPTLCCVLLLLVTYLPVPVPVPLFVFLYNLLIVIV